MISLVPPHPRLFPASTSLRHWFGSIELGDFPNSTEYRLSIEQVSPPSVRPAQFRLFLSPELSSILSPPEVRTRLLKRFSFAASPAEAIKELVDVANRAIQSAALQRQSHRIENFSLPADSKFFARLIDELGQFSEAVKFSDSSMQKLSIAFNDPKQRVHELFIRIPSDWPVGFLEISSDLPCELSQIYRTIGEATRNFQRAIEKFQNFFDEIDEFDSECWILEPDRPLRSITFRRFAVGRGSSILVNFDPLRPSAMPEVKFLGSELSIEPLRQRWNSSSVNWNSDPSAGSVRRQLESILQLKFPAKEISTDEKENFSTECSICYLFQLNGEVPTVVCENSSCSKIYHRECLQEWFQSISTTGGESNQGACVFCTKWITIR